MAYKVDPGVKSVHGTNPQNLIERIVRDRIFASKYWKEQCFGLNVADLVGRAMQLKYAGGTFGTHRYVSPFICLLLKLLMIQPPDDIIQAFIQEEHFRYVRMLGAFYLRLTGTSVEIYRCLERLYPDNRKFKLRHLDGSFSIEYIDNFIDQLLHEERVFDTTLPRLMLRHALVERNLLPKQRPSLLDAELQDYGQDDLEEKSFDKDASEDFGHFSPKKSLGRRKLDDQSPSSSPPRRRLGDRSPSSSPPRRRLGDRSPSSSPPRRRLGDRSPSSGPPRRRLGDRSPSSSPPRRRLDDRSPSSSPPRRRLGDRSVNPNFPHNKRAKASYSNSSSKAQQDHSFRSRHYLPPESIDNRHKRTKRQDHHDRFSYTSPDRSGSDEYKELKALRASGKLDIDSEEETNKNKSKNIKDEQSLEDQSTSESGGPRTLTLEETNELRTRIGLKPLEKL